MTDGELSIRLQLDAELQRLKLGSRTASADFFLAALEPLTRFLVGKHRALSREQARDIATEAIANVVASPDIVDLSRASVCTFLCLVCYRDAMDLVRSQGGHEKLLEGSVQDFEDWWGGANDHERAELQADARKLWTRYGNQLATNDAEREVLRLILDGERATQAYARVLGLPETGRETVELVKKAKDRMLARLRRLRDDL